MGGIIGGVIGVLLLVVLVAAFLVVRRQRQRAKEMENDAELEMGAGFGVGATAWGVGDRVEALYAADRGGATLAKQSSSLKKTQASRHPPSPLSPWTPTSFMTKRTCTYRFSPR